MICKAVQGDDAVAVIRWIYPFSTHVLISFQAENLIIGNKFKGVECFMYLPSSLNHHSIHTKVQ